LVAVVQVDDRQPPEAEDRVVVVQRAALVRAAVPAQVERGSEIVPNLFRGAVVAEEAEQAAHGVALRSSGSAAAQYSRRQLSQSPTGRKPIRRYTPVEVGLARSANSTTRPRPSSRRATAAVRAAE
jgi:hypothetical protein